MNYTTTDLASVAVNSPNPMTRFAVVAEVGDTFNGVTLTRVERVQGFKRCTFSAHGTTWTQDYAVKGGE